MSGPRNNLDDVLKRRPQTSSSSSVPATSSSQSQEGSTKPKFRAATKPATPALPMAAKAPVQKTSSYTSFSTPGFGKKTPAPISGSSSSPVVVSSTETSPASAQDQRITTAAAATSTPIAQMITGLPSKRSSPSTFHTSDSPSKRPRPSTESYPGDKENLFDNPEEPIQVASDVDDAPPLSHNDKGKGRDTSWDSAPPPSQRNIDFSRATPARPRTLAHTPASRVLPRPLTFASNIRNHAPTPSSPSPFSQATSSTRVESTIDNTNNGARRSATLDYSGLLNMSMEDLLNTKGKILDMRAAMIELHGTLDNDAGTDGVRVMLRDYDDLTQDRLACIDALISAIKSGSPRTLPPPKWAPGSRLPSATPVAAPPVSSFSQFVEPDPVYDPPPPRPERPSLFEPCPDMPEEEPEDDFGEPMSLDDAPAQSFNPPSPVPVSESDSEDALWGHFSGEQDEVEVISHSPVASSSTRIIRPPARVDTEDSAVPYQPDPALAKRSYYKDLVSVRNSVFKIPSWRRNQLESICSVMDGNDTFNLMPTGGGKSLTFQLPAVVMHRKKRQMTIVVTPLLALMSDQKQALQKKGVSVMSFRSDDNGPQDVSPDSNLLFDRNDGPALVYVTPERILKSDWFQNTLRQLYAQGRIFMFAVDEVHTISSWGRSFREALSRLGWLRENLPNVPIMALTATATIQQREEIINTLGIRRCQQFVMSFNRPNLDYVIKPKSGGKDNLIKDIAEFIRSKHSGHTGIIYRQSREDCMALAANLSEVWDIPALPFHGELTKREREWVQREWQIGNTKVVVATIAFGMGIDKDNVRFVVHYSLPESLSAYYQETGRAGRDGQPSDCVLYYAYRDAQWLKRCASMDAKDEMTRVEKMTDARRVVEYCLNITDCRRTQVLSYFGEQFPREKCNERCDNCRDKSPITWEDASTQAYQFIELAQEIQKSSQNATRIMYIDAFLGRTNESIRTKKFDQLNAFKIGQGTDRGRAERIFDDLICKEVFEPHYVSGKHSQQVSEYFKLTAKGKAFLRNKEKLMMPFREPPPKAKKTKAAKGKGRAKKATEIADDPIEDEEDYAPQLTFPAGVDGVAPVAGPSTKNMTVFTSAREVIARHTVVKKTITTVPEVVDIDGDSSTHDEDDDEVTILDPPPSRAPAPSQARSGLRTRDEVMQECYKELVTLRDRIAHAQKLEPDALVSDEALQYISAMLPEDVQELRGHLADVDDGSDLADGILHSLITVVLKHRANLPPKAGSRSKPSSSSKKAIGTRSKPPSISELHSNYEFRQAGSTIAASSTSAWPPNRKRK